MKKQFDNKRPLPPKSKSDSAVPQREIGKETGKRELLPTLQSNKIVHIEGSYVVPGTPGHKNVEYLKKAATELGIEIPYFNVGNKPDSEYNAARSILGAETTLVQTPIEIDNNPFDHQFSNKEPGSRTTISDQSTLSKGGSQYASSDSIVRTSRQHSSAEFKETQEPHRQSSVETIMASLGQVANTVKKLSQDIGRKLSGSLETKQQSSDQSSQETRQSSDRQSRYDEIEKGIFQVFRQGIDRVDDLNLELITSKVKDEMLQIKNNTKQIKDGSPSEDAIENLSKPSTRYAVLVEKEILLDLELELRKKGLDSNTGKRWGLEGKNSGDAQRSLNEKLKKYEKEGKEILLNLEVELRERGLDPKTGERWGLEGKNSDDVDRSLNEKLEEYKKESDHQKKLEFERDVVDKITYSIQLEHAMFEIFQEINKAQKQAGNSDLAERKRLDAQGVITNRQSSLNQMVGNFHKNEKDLEEILMKFSAEYHENSEIKDEDASKN